MDAARVAAEALEGLAIANRRLADRSFTAEEYVSVVSIVMDLLATVAAEASTADRAGVVVTDPTAASSGLREILTAWFRRVVDDVALAENADSIAINLTSRGGDRPAVPVLDRLLTFDELPFQNGFDIEACVDEILDEAAAHAARFGTASMRRVRYVASVANRDEQISFTLPAGAKHATARANRRPTKRKKAKARG